VAGATIEDAQRAMGVSKSTRKTHTTNLLRKLGARDLKEATIAVLRTALKS
jgi:DNA-binding NarL/FixJ family response regulator